jgi:hypothetical protein
MDCGLGFNILWPMATEKAAGTDWRRGGSTTLPPGWDGADGQTRARRMRGRLQLIHGPGQIAICCVIIGARRTKKPFENPETTEAPPRWPPPPPASTFVNASRR